MKSAFRRLLPVLTKWLLGLRSAVSSCKLVRRMFNMEIFAMSFVTVASVCVYIYATMYILPFVLSEESAITQFIAFVAACWCLFGVLANLFLLRHRDSSIRHRFLNQPVIAPAPSPILNADPGAGLNSTQPQNSDDQLIRERKDADQIKYLGQQFLNTPFGSETAWHICAVCEVFVPPRAWHCMTCNTCILRRDHHCVFAMSCVGEDNHIHFLGFLLYLTIGASYATIIGMYYMYYNFGISPLWFILRSFFSWYIIFFDFSYVNILAAVAFIGGITSASIFSYYFMLAMKNQTSADRSRGVKRSVTNGKQYSYTNLKKFLGPNPILRIIWPLSPVLKNDYGLLSSEADNTIKTA